MVSSLPAPPSPPLHILLTVQDGLSRTIRACVFPSLKEPQLREEIADRDLPTFQTAKERCVTSRFSLKSQSSIPASPCPHRLLDLGSKAPYYRRFRHNNYYRFPSKAL